MTRSLALRPLLATILVLACLSGAAFAEAPELRFPGPALPTGSRAEARARLDMPEAGFNGTSVPMRATEGPLDLRAWRLDDSRATTLDLIEPLEQQLLAQGYRVEFHCATEACGGFDFRYAMQVLPEPEMHVDLGDFRYLLATGPKGQVVNLLVSRAQDRGFVQMTWVGQAEALPSPPATTVAPENPQMEETAAEAPLVTSDLVSTLQTKGSAPLDDLTFAIGKAALAEGDFASLKALAAWLTQDPKRNVVLVGHTDALGSLAGNIALSRARAEAVRDRLVSLGVPAGQVAAEGAGYLAPRATNQTEEGRQQNRRVEVVLTSLPGG